ncbi:hypothetical protein [Halolamina sp.]|uniref:hypothetical protein n=1 Tax=Halolamina sp. TaxID=1940283 RepID=UPI0006782427
MIIRDDDAFVGALSLEDLEALLTPPIVRPGEWEGLAVGYRVILDMLQETLFTALSRASCWRPAGRSRTSPITPTRPKPVC